MIFGYILLVFASICIWFSAVFCRYLLGEFERILGHFEAVTRVDCYLVSVYRGILLILVGLAFGVVITSSISFFPLSVF